MATRLWDGTKFLGEAKLGATTLDVHHCGSCGVIFAMDEHFADARRDDKQTWYCPNGCMFSWRGKPLVDELKDKLKEQERRTKATRDLLAAEERSHVAMRGHLTRARKRAQHGVCPCCSRTFANVARHVASQHPEFDPTITPE